MLQEGEPWLGDRQAFNVIILYNNGEESIEWTKETVSQIIKEYHSSGVILEQTYNPFNSDFWSTKKARQSNKEDFCHLGLYR